MQTKKLTLLEIKQAMRDSRFRQGLPSELANDVRQYEQNPGCACNLSVYRNILQYAKENLKEYFPDREIPTATEDIENLARNHWSVINCAVNELEDRLKKLPMGRKQVAVARWENQVTVIINELEHVLTI